VRTKDAGIARELIGAEEIQRRVGELAADLDERYEAETPLLVGVLTGAVSFMVDLMQAMRIPAEIDFMAVSSYGR
jgi:hypoxanthine phosphoribosyltransferase